MIHLAKQTPRQRWVDTDSATNRSRHEVAITALSLHPYAHRCFMGLAPAFVADSQCMSVLEHLQPDLHAKAAALRNTPGPLMRELEGSPVLAAYGLRRAPDVPLAMEWDFWIDPDAPENIDKARVTHGNTVTRERSREPAFCSLARRVMVEAVDGTDVHLGLAPRSWLEIHQRAAEAFGLTFQQPEVILDIKSPWSDGVAVGACVRSLKSAGIGVQRVLAFVPEQIAQVPDKGHLVHGIGGLALGIKAGRFEPNDVVLFNGGDFIEYAKGQPQISARKFGVFSASLARTPLRIGLYLQENSLGPAEANLLASFVNNHPQRFAIGLAYGSLPGVAAVGVSGSGVGLQQPQVDLEWNDFEKAFGEAA